MAMLSLEIIQDILRLYKYEDPTQFLLKYENHPQFDQIQARVVSYCDNLPNYNKMVEHFASERKDPTILRFRVKWRNPRKSDYTLIPMEMGEVIP